MQSFFLRKGGCFTWAVFSIGITLDLLLKYSVDYNVLVSTFRSRTGTFFGVYNLFTLKTIVGLRFSTFFFYWQNNFTNIKEGYIFVV